MTIFAILLPVPTPSIDAAIKQSFPNDCFQITPTQWLVSGKNTAIEVVAKIGVYDAANPTKASNGNAIVFATSSYYGRASSAVWDWIKAKLESSS